MATPRRGSWPVLAVNSAVAVTVLVLVAVLALVVNPPAPPGIAAFAPQASKPITKAPPGQSAQFGNGAGQCGTGQVCAGPTPTPTVTTPVATSPPPQNGAPPPGLQCYKWPNGAITQTFDPQSPPCVSVWDDSKGNGGATSQGVSATEIKVALPVAAPGSSFWPGISPIVDFFNTRYQMYGRKITIVPVPSQQADGNLNGRWNDPELQRADAAQIRAAKPFATFDFIDPITETATLPVFMDAMAKAKIVSVNGGDTTPFDTAAALAKRAPYVWSYYPPVDQVVANTAAMTCAQLVGKPASHAPDPNLRNTTRKFAVFIPESQRLGGGLPGLSGLLARLKGCGVEAKVVQAPGGATNQSQAAAFSQMKREGVTSVIFLPWGGNGSATSDLNTARQVGFQPEWVVMGWIMYNTAFMLNDPPAETSGAFGVGMWNKMPPLALEPFKQAQVSVGGEGDYPNLRGFYQELQLLASGIQMAGPRLTPETFAKGLHETQFPNPGAAGPPSYQATVGFAGNDVVMTDDYVAFWLDTRTTGQQVSSSPSVNEEKAFCQVGFGLRWTEDTWPRRDRFYEPGVCR